MRIIYLGTPDVAVAPLEALCADHRYDVVGVVTQPDRPVGRSGTPQPPPVKQAAERLGLPIIQPETLRDDAAIAQIKGWNPDVGVIAAYGEILRRRVLTIPPHGYLNIHPSLLPRWRGPTPVASAILAGDTHTGVTIIKLDAKMDSGPIVAQESEPLAPDARTDSLTMHLFEHGAALLCEVLTPYVAGALQPIAQEDAQATYTRMLSRADGQIDWNESAAQIERMIRAYTPWPGATTIWRNQPLKILAATLDPTPTMQPVGTVVRTPNGPAVSTSAGALVLSEVQPAGKRAMAALAWQNGLQAGERLGA